MADKILSLAGVMTELLSEFGGDQGYLPNSADVFSADLFDDLCIAQVVPPGSAASKSILARLELALVSSESKALIPEASPAKTKEELLCDACEAGLVKGFW